MLSKINIERAGENEEKHAKDMLLLKFVLKFAEKLIAVTCANKEFFGGMYSLKFTYYGLFILVLNLN